jgi:hypothetical protein
MGKKIHSKCESKLMDFNVTDYEKLMNIVSYSTL